MLDYKTSQFKPSLTSNWNKTYLRRDFNESKCVWEGEKEGGKGKGEMEEESRERV